ncbi:aquaporin [Aspergillus sclerotioniger CBS 115572]|uniref:Aquaporin n=1 Tax=Aspergillus sclerotioniger CBS 115572 TaxID=1450535 RepID=A0A317X2T9_9EURO|nr:aquaporin [Aspergillus sclerotioniger CBS 115572]PWY91817.1 aquaporin [Aspergillus sclerotioniger CBS 115572]
MATLSTPTTSASLDQDTPTLTNDKNHITTTTTTTLSPSTAHPLSPTQPTTLQWLKSRPYIRAAISEFLGTMILLLFGDGVVAQVLLSHGEKGNYQSISWGWALGVMLAIYTSTPSGSHLNPAVTFTSCLLRHFPWSYLPLYTLSQILGAMAGSAIVYLNYNSAITLYEGGPHLRTVPNTTPETTTATAGIFATYPVPFLSKASQFLSEFLASAILMFLIFALKDEHNLGGDSETGKKLFPLAMFFVVFGIGACFGWETGYAINLARDFGPRLVSFWLGYGGEVWRAGVGIFGYVPMVAPFVGCTLGGWLYDAFIYIGDDSVVNTPYMGLGWLVKPLRQKQGASQTHSPA